MVRQGLLFSIPLLIATLAFSVAGWLMVPEGQEIPVHWNTDGEVNRTTGPTEAFVLMPGIALGLTLIFAVAPFIDPRGRNLQRSKPLWLAGWIGSLTIIAIAQGIITLAAIGVIEVGSSILPQLIGSAVAVFIVILGNLLSKARPNWFAGIRTPWTLSSDHSWDVTHRWAARLFIAAGIVSFPALWLSEGQTGWIILTVAVSIAALVPLGLSYVVWRGDPERETYSADQTE
jgi:uncharacterized membrane protein